MRNNESKFVRVFKEFIGNNNDNFETRNLIAENVNIGLAVFSFGGCVMFGNLLAQGVELNSKGAIAVGIAGLAATAVYVADAAYHTFIKGEDNSLLAKVLTSVGAVCKNIVTMPIEAIKELVVKKSNSNHDSYDVC